ncbi:MAG: methyltransferase domain-containing protein [Gammaproteobacteria bacterium]|nr:MAG: methyltransferase domain-containing protein [Gammaproteobacteria bacterium]
MKSDENQDVDLSRLQSSTEKSYDTYPYESHPFPLTHPEHLSVLAKLFGMSPASPQKCRVLELGCAAGGNLIPMAVQLPKSQFFGVDLSGMQIKQGQERIKALKLKNIKIEHKDILDVGGRIRKFDYIICHGVYSWVPDDVRKKILAICRDYLNDNGVAYISYNTYPGWHMRESIRNMMQFHVAQFSTMQEKVDQSRALLNFLVESVETEGNPYGEYLAKELASLSGARDTYIAHEHLEGQNEAVYFHQFAQHASEYELQYLSDADFSSMLATNFPAKVAQTLQRVGRNLVQMEQYMDFLRNRMFRASLLCEKDIELKRAIDPGVITDLHIASPIKPDKGDVDLTSSIPQEFVTPKGIRIGAGNAVTKAAFKILGDLWPSSIPFNDLLDRAVKLTGAKGKTLQEGLAADLLKAYTANGIELHSSKQPFVIKVSDKPMTTALVRNQIESGLVVTNQRHESVTLTEPLRQLLKLLDGKHTQKQLLEKLTALILDNVLVIQEEGKPIRDEARLQAFVPEFLKQMLSELAKRALLIG